MTKLLLLFHRKAIDEPLSIGSEALRHLAGTNCQSFILAIGKAVVLFSAQLIEQLIVRHGEGLFQSLEDSAADVCKNPCTA